MISVQQPRIALNLFPGEMLDEMRHEEVLVAAWKYSLWAQEVRNLIFKKAATCSLLRPCSHLQPLAATCSHLQPPAQAAASDCKWLQVTAFSKINMIHLCSLCESVCKVVAMFGSGVGMVDACRPKSSTGRQDRGGAPLEEHQGT